MRQKRKNLNVLVGHLPGGYVSFRQAGFAPGILQKSEKLAYLKGNNEKLEKSVEHFKEDRKCILNTIQVAVQEAEKGEEGTREGKLLARAERTLTEVGQQTLKLQEKLQKMREERGERQVGLEIEERNDEI